MSIETPELSIENNERKFAFFAKNLKRELLTEWREQGEEGWSNDEKRVFLYGAVMYELCKIFKNNPPINLTSKLQVISLENENEYIDNSVDVIIEYLRSNIPPAEIEENLKKGF